MAYSVILEVMNDPSFFPVFFLATALFVSDVLYNSCDSLFFLFRASRSLNNKVSTAQHEAILAQVFCDEVEIVVHF